MEEMDREILLDFFDESLEGLEKVSALLVDLEAGQDDLSLINAIFRPVHSLKGNSAFFGLMHVKKLAHELETILDLLRKQQTKVSGPLMAGLFDGIDALRAMLQRVRGQQPEVEDADAFNVLLQRVKGLAKPADKAGQWAKLVEKLDSISIRLGKEDKPLLADLEAAISDLKSLAPVSAPQAADSASRPLHALQSQLQAPISGTLSETQSRIVLEGLRRLQTDAPNAELAAQVAEAIRVYDVFTGSAVGFDDLCRETLLAAVQKMAAQWPVKAEQAQSRDSVAEAAAKSTDGNRAGLGDGRSESAKTMRVSEDSIDQFLEYVGELLVVGDMFHHIERSMATLSLDRALANRLRTVNETFSVLSDNLRRSIMAIRKVSVKSLLQKAARIARDVAKGGGKEIAVEIEGGDTEIDKSLVDMLDAPLTHMIRNSVDHGIEAPSDRTATGKEPRGLVRVTIAEDDRFVTLTVADDGRGLDEEAIKRKAVSMGMIRPEQTMTQADIVNLLFAPGLSTAKTVTDVSGRGVGMDVVKRAIENAGGAIACESEAGRGSVFTVRVPRTLATEIMQGFLVQDDGATYVLPMDYIRETISAEPEDIKTVEGRGLCMVRHGRIYPVCRLGAMFDERSAAWERRERYTLVLVETGGTWRAMAVDQVVGIQQVVVRSVEGEIGKPEFVSGGAVMGDGQVAIVVDIAKMFA